MYLQRDVYKANNLKMLMVNKGSTMKTAFVVWVILLSSIGYAQLDHTHYFPPIKQEGTGSIDQQAFYISTPEITPFDIEIFVGTSTTPIILSGLSNTHPLKYDVADGTNDVTLVSDANTGLVIRNSGLRFVAASGQKFYVNYRCKSRNQAGSLTCKGQKALGTDFRWGGIPSVSAATNDDLNDVLGIMASEDNTIVTISGYNPNVVFRLGNNSSGWTSDTITINLNANESFVLEVLPRLTSFNFEGWLGATIIATNPIAISSSGLTATSNRAKDLTMDQIVPTDVIGQQYGFIRGNGTDETEFPLIVATKDNTDIYVNGVYHATINNGGFLKVSGSFYSSSVAGANLFVESSKKVYAYQCLTGEVGRIQTIGMNFLPPLSCLLPTSFDHISDISDIAGSPSFSSAITIIASTDTPNEEIEVYQNNIEISKPTPVSFNGTADWKSFFIEDLLGNIKVVSSGSIAIGFFVNDGGNAGFAGYFSGFDVVPDTEIILVTEGGCLPGGRISIKDTALSYQWYKNGIEIPNATSNELELTEIGAYYVDIVTRSGCLYKSETYDAKYCYDVQVNKTADKSVVLEGDQVTYSINVENKGALPIKNIIIEENFPNELQIDAQSNTLGVWDAPTWGVAVLEEGVTANLTIVGSLASDGVSSMATNNLMVAYDEKALNEQTVPDDLEETIEIINGEIKITSVSAELEIPYRIIQGDVLNFTFTVENVGDILLSRVHLTNNLFEFELNDVYVSGDVNNDGVLDFDEIWLYKTPYNITQAEINNLEVVSTSNTIATQPNFYNQSHEVEYIFPIDPEFVVPYVDLAIELDGNGPEIYINDEVDVLLNLTSDEVSDVNNLTISSPLPTGLEFLSYSSDVGVYDEVDGIWKINTLPKSSNINLRLKAKMLATGEHVVNAEIVSFNELDSITNNNKAAIEFVPICYKVFNEFSPNDDGINDELVIQCVELSENISLKIFNRVGVLVYESNNYKNEFSGFGNKGNYINKNKRLPNGTYFYVLNLKNDSEEKKGWVYINR